MGIKSNFSKTIKIMTSGTDAIVKIHISDFRYKKIAVDSSLYLFKFKAAMGNRWLHGMLNLVKCLRMNDVHPVFVFDGKSPIEKKDEQNERREGRRKLEADINIIQNDINTFHSTGVISDKLNQINTVESFNIQAIEEKLSKKIGYNFDICSDDFVVFKNMLTVMNVPFYTAPSEAEKMCSKLCIDGIVSAVLSDDSDVIAYSTPLSLSKLNTSTGECILVRNKNLLNELQINNSQFLDFCIMCGTDYNKNIKGIGSMTAFKHILKHKNIEVFSEKENIDITGLNHNVVRSLFTDFENYDITNVPFCGQIEYNAFLLFVQDNNIDINPYYYFSCFKNKNLKFHTLD